MSDTDDLDLEPWECDNALLSDFSDWLQHHLLQFRWGLTWAQPGTSDDAQAPSADLYAGHRDLLRYAIVNVLAHQLPMAMPRINAVYGQHYDQCMSVVASVDWLAPEARESLPRWMQVWDAGYWWSRMWGWIRASAWGSVKAHLYHQVGDHLLDRLDKLPSGNGGGVDREYELLVRDMLRFVYGHQLCHGRYQVRTVDEAQRRDWMYENRAEHGPWEWLSKHRFRIPVVTVDAKNEKDPIGGPTIDDVARYIGVGKAGNVAVLACRRGPAVGSPAAKHLTWLASHGQLVIPLDDEAFRTMIRAVMSDQAEAADEVVYAAVNSIILRQ